VRPALLSIFLWFLAVGALHADPPASTRFRLDQAAAGGGSVPLAAGPYRAGATSGQGSIGASSSGRFVLQSGFWGHAGAGHVPILLWVDKTPGPRATIDLSWSGRESLFDIQRSEDLVTPSVVGRRAGTTEEAPE